MNKRGKPYEGLVMAGLSHHEAKIDLRERLSVSPEELPSTLAELSRGGGLRGVVVMSTCNRLEIYASAEDPANAERLLAAYFALRCPGSETVVTMRRGRDAVLHLFRVAAGLDSIVVGEHQVLSQVKAAYQRALELRRTDRLLNKLFQAAFGSGKKVRSETGIAQGITSCGGAAVALAQKLLGNGAPARRVLLIGAGKIAETAAQHMLEHRNATLTIANRDVERAASLAAKFGASAVGLEEGMGMIAAMDVIIVSTACPHYLVTTERLAKLAAARGGAPLLVIDLGVPRNVDPAAADIPGVHLRNVDHLEAAVAETLSRRRGELQAAESITGELMREFCAGLAEEATMLEYPGRLAPRGAVS